MRSDGVHIVETGKKNLWRDGVHIVETGKKNLWRDGVHIVETGKVNIEYNLISGINNFLGVANSLLRTR